MWDPLTFSDSCRHLHPPPSAGDSHRFVQVSTIHTCCCNKQFSEGLLCISKATTKAKGIDAAIKEKINANCCGDQKAKVNK